MAFSLQREPDDLWGLYLRPLPPSALQTLFGDAHEALVLDGWGRCRRIPWSQVGRHAAGCELVHLAPHSEIADGWEPPCPLLIAPSESFLPDTELVVSLLGGLHGVAFSRSTQPLVRLLNASIQAHSQWILPESNTPPMITDELLDELASPTAEGIWTHLSLHVHRKFVTMDVCRADEGAIVEVDRWVAEVRDGRWRGGWRF